MPDPDFAGAVQRAGLGDEYCVVRAPSEARIDQRLPLIVFGAFDHPQWFEKRAAVRKISVLRDGNWAEKSGDLQPHDIVLIHPVSAEHAGGLYGLVGVVDRLLGPGGCPWDQEQTHKSLQKYLLEEAYELFDAIDDERIDRMREELGDVLLQPIMHAQMQALAGGFNIDDVAQSTADKLVRRHPHVFGDTEAHTAEEVLKNWDQIKKTEHGTPKSVLQGVPKTMPALLRAHEISKRAARSGFEWPDLAGVLDKMHEEIDELRAAVASSDQAHIAAELGDLLFTIVNVGRWLRIEPEEALRRMLDRFTERFMWMESHANLPLRELSPEQWDDLWNQAKAAQIASTVKQS